MRRPRRPVLPVDVRRSPRCSGRPTVPAPRCAPPTVAPPAAARTALVRRLPAAAGWTRWCWPRPAPGTRRPAATVERAAAALGERLGVPCGGGLLLRPPRGPARPCGRCVRAGARRVGDGRLLPGARAALRPGGGARRGRPARLRWRSRWRCAGARPVVIGRAWWRPRRVGRSRRPTAPASLREPALRAAAALSTRPWVRGRHRRRDSADGMTGIIGRSLSLRRSVAASAP